MTSAALSSSLAPDSSPLRSERRLNERIYKPNVSKNSPCNPSPYPAHQGTPPDDVMEKLTKFVDEHSAQIKELLAKAGKL
ncbi:uncharacterized protein N7483_008277 [Penicillium malachiteum]|uniref:uncharacterized protein n=1 Tax=Penicillium malachiteum TaxID=1324776 RepID=UPI00254846AA|nr:uncharacterized protein N7483_008277 [Penicillium malachiteum]KAJ5720343.1 hypothetical protein N7483_008277 [Penicillium malachiteum]